MRDGELVLGVGVDFMTVIPFVFATMTVPFRGTAVPIVVPIPVDPSRVNPQAKKL